MLRETRTVHIRTGAIRLNNRSYQLSPEFAGRKVEVVYEANKSCDTAEPEFQAMTARLLERELTEEELAYLSSFFFENAPMTARRTELLLAQVVSAKGKDLHLRSYCSHLKQGLNQQRS